MANQETTKVGKGDAAKGEAPAADKAPKGKPAFDITTAVNAEGTAIALDDNGRMTGVPANFDPKVHAGLPRTVFTDRATFLEHRARLLDIRIGVIQKQRDDTLVAAKEAREGVDPTKVKLRKLEKLQKMAAELEAQLKADGIEV